MSRSLPVPSKISQPFWDSCKAERMRLQRCDDCGTYAYYPVYVCPECASRALTWTSVSGAGTVHTFTVAARSSFDIEGPLVVALIELDEGAMMVSNIITSAPENVHIGMPVRVRYEKASDDITLPMFEPA
ncbi:MULTISPECIES: Zn-ribbon domain-containing OB-fold protein [unclassified Chelatococcus]|uniref:Zn-ribbon domain-containing OB-fold protein n=1 Tax=unclassified Chelatococcus TaxID=2638111 RepID=UPI001BCEC2A2|nr:MULTISPECIES: Zn-ribbon domain-containing OB-fold protein [unclassified Chelatococcus]MBS7700315.1 Zn-ribbon domain-containing OB-fold protein [Chelatococcus sp. YT9]MBX3556111.1 Zn-ribbon domain-containing OB-fold protein [Chelatococcus sp.]